MRFLTFALLGLVLAAAPAPAAERSAGSSQRAQAGKQLAGKQRAVARLGNARRPAQPVVHRSAPMRGQIGVARDQRAASAAGGCASRKGVRHCRTARMSWTQGLSPAAGTQANECPDGTMATLARGHDDIVRCMPI